MKKGLFDRAPTGNGQLNDLYANFEAMRQPVVSEYRSDPRTFEETLLQHTDLDRRGAAEYVRDLLQARLSPDAHQLEALVSSVEQEA